MPFTREQLLAQSADRHLAVTASAGSGKTSVLVQRYAHLLLSGIDSRSIVAITFTRKAAAEMTARVAKTIEEKLAKATEPVELKKLRTIRERLTSAKISTIHSFCSQLLRDFPIEAEVVPNFTELTQSEDIVLREKMALDTMEEWLDQNHPHREDALLVFRTLGRKTVHTYLKMLLSNSETLRLLEDVYSHGDEFLLEKAAHLSREMIATEFHSAIVAFRHLLSEIDTSSLKTKQQFEINEAREILHRIKIQIQSNRTFPLADLAELLQEFETVKTVFFTNTNTLRSTFKKAVSDAEITTVESAIQQASSSINKNTVEAFRSAEMDEQLITLARILFAMAREASIAIEAEKNSRGALNFDDLQLKALTLLENESVRQKLRRKIRFLMMDEFQDTNILQYEIAKRLVSALELSAKHTTGTSTNLFIVGDAKQSIYGFRGADVRVFEEARKDIQSANKRDLEEGIIPADITTPHGKIVALDNEKYGDIRLSATFRLLPAVAGFVNKVCGTIMPSETAGYDVGYEPIVCARHADRLNPADGSITFLLAEKAYQDKSNSLDESTDDETDDTDTGSEAEILARHIAVITGNENPRLVFGGNPEKSRPAEYGDIAVLSRSRNGFEALTTAFRRMEIPFVVHSGKGFFSTQEITDIHSYLSFLHNPNDDLSLAAVLRSPFFAWSDADIYTIGISNKSKPESKPLWERLCELCEGDTIQRDSLLVRAYGLLREVLPLAARMPIPSLIRLLLERSGWRAVITRSERAAQMEANIEKLIDFAREFEHKGFRNLYDFVEELTVLSNGDTNESEATIQQGVNAVNIMTIHSSKGLEFPIVALYQTNKNTPNPPQLNVNNDVGITFPLPNEEEGNILTPLQLIASNRKKTAEEAEAKRLLYVALTRAKDHLIISGMVKRTKSGGISKINGVLEMLFRGIDRNPEDLLFNHSEEIIVHLPILIDDTTQERECVIPVDFAISIEETEAVGFIQVKQQQPLLLLDALETTIEDEYFSASQMMFYESNPDGYIRTYRLGLAEDDDTSAPIISESDTTDSVAGSLAGTIIHEVMSKLPLWLDANGNIRTEILEKQITDELTIAERHTNQQLAERIHTETENVARSPLIQRFATAFQTAKQEYPLQIPVGKDFLVGVLDVLVQNSTGEWEIWDWKTNKITQEKGADELFEHYRLQLECYIYFCSLAFPEQQNFIARLLFTRLATTNAPDETWTRILRCNREQALRLGETLTQRMNEMKAGY
ncbi:MAG: UvrD-helicase domain-containing protein [Bacteroidetes bacterium]|nr:UvrD-helicase domain-containing protein [Bacteroidota bacterium]